MQDLANRDDVERLVVEFYETAFRDPMIGPIFTDVAHMDLAAHLPIMCDFWETVLFRTGAYRRNALQVHVALHTRHPLTEAHFARWLELWDATVDAEFAGPAAERAKLQAAGIAGSMRRRLSGGSGSAFETLTSRDRAAETAGT